MIRVKVRYLLWLKDKTGVEYEEYSLNDGSTVKDLLDILANRYGSLSKHLVEVFEPNSSLIILVNNVKPEPHYRLKDNDAVILMPTVSGG